MSYLCSMTRAPSRRLADVAKKVGVSEATVSRVLNGKPGVSDATRETVLTALDVLGYERPTQLRGERARLIGLVLPELQNPIFPALAEVIGGALAQRGFTPVLCIRTAGGLSEADYVEHAARPARFRGGVRGRPPRRAGGPARPLPAAAQPRHPGGAVQRGSRRPGLPLRVDRRRDRRGPGLRPPGLARPSAHRPGGWGPRTTCPRGASSPRSPRTPSGASGSGAVEHALFSLEGGQAATTRLLRHGVTGVICASDVLALGAIRAIRRAGLSVPGDVSVVGYDDSAFMNCTDPPLTTVRQPIESMGKAAVALLVNQIENVAVYPEELLFEPELVVRGSTGRPGPRSGG